MSKKIYLFSLVLLALAFTACSETEEVSRYDNWQARSEAFIDSIANVYAGQRNGSIEVTDEKERLYAFTDQTTNQTVYVKKIQNGKGTVSPQYTSVVKLYYRRAYFNGDVIKQNFTGIEPSHFDSPQKFAISSSSDKTIEVIQTSGCSYTLIHMKVGDFWTLYVPYQSGYGSGTDPNIAMEPYSALVYNIKMDEIVEL